MRSLRHSSRRPGPEGPSTGIAWTRALEPGLVAYYNELCPDTLCEGGYYEFTGFACGHRDCTVSFQTQGGGPIQQLSFPWQGPVVQRDMDLSCPAVKSLLGAVHKVHLNKVGPVEFEICPLESEKCFKDLQSRVKHAGCAGERSGPLLRELCGKGHFPSCSRLLAHADDEWVAQLIDRVLGLCGEGDVSACDFAYDELRSLADSPSMAMNARHGLDYVWRRVGPP